jgi:succinylglutamate desuccinylase
MRHIRFLDKKHRYQHTSINQLFDNKAEHQTDEPKKMSYGQKVFDMVKGINIKFGKKNKKVEKERPK